MYKNQIALVGKPTRTGAQVISIIQDELLSKDINKKDFLFQLSTPNGYEIDFIYLQAIKYEYFKKLIEKSSVNSIIPNSNENKTLEQLKEKNILLKKELSNYIPLEDKVFITQQKCRISSEIIITNQMLDLKTVKDKGKEIKFNTKYYNNEYTRPIYNPSWKEHSEKGWAYVPRKICEAMHNLFVIPKDAEKQQDFFGSLGFHETYGEIKKDEIGLLVYNFTPKKIITLNNQLLITGVPSRTGARIISFDENNLIKNKDYIIQLVTPDNLEIDFEVIRNIS